MNLHSVLACWVPKRSSTIQGWLLFLEETVRLAASCAFKQQQPLSRCLSGVLCTCRLCVGYRLGVSPQCWQSTVDQSRACCWVINWQCLWLVCCKLDAVGLEVVILLHEYYPGGGLSVSQTCIVLIPTMFYSVNEKHSIGDPLTY